MGDDPSKTWAELGVLFRFPQQLAFFFFLIKDQVSISHKPLLKIFALISSDHVLSGATYTLQHIRQPAAPSLLLARSFVKDIQLLNYVDETPDLNVESDRKL